MTVSAPAVPDPAAEDLDIWRLLVVHRTVITYADTVNTSYNEARQHPADETGQAVLSTRMEIEPFEGVLTYRDHFGTRVSAFDVHRPHRTLTITSTSTVETFPLDRSRWTTEAPMTWAELDASDCWDRLEEFLSPGLLTSLNDELFALAQDIRAASPGPREAGHAVADFVRSALQFQAGVTDIHTSAVEAFLAKKGVCQDFSHLSTGMLRAMGIPARYVSGYLHPQPDAPLGETVTGESHAWVEWFDGSWVPFDVTNGIRILGAHVVVGRGRDYADVPPLRGVYAGPDASGNEVVVKVTRLR